MVVVVLLLLLMVAMLVKLTKRQQWTTSDPLLAADYFDRANNLLIITLRTFCSLRSDWALGVVSTVCP